MAPGNEEKVHVTRGQKATEVNGCITISIHFVRVCKYLNIRICGDHFIVRNRVVKKWWNRHNFGRSWPKGLMWSLWFLERKYQPGITMAPGNEEKVHVTRGQKATEINGCINISIHFVRTCKHLNNRICGDHFIVRNRVVKKWWNRHNFGRSSSRVLNRNDW